MSGGCGAVPCYGEPGYPYQNCGYPTALYGCREQVAPCLPPVPQIKPVPVQLDQLNSNLFGPISTAIVNDRPVQQANCDINSQLPWFPRNVGEGFLCYLLRFLMSNVLNLNGSVISSGWGSPNGVVPGNVGDLYTNKTGGPGSTLYVKESGSGTNTGWTPK